MIKYRFEYTTCGEPAGWAATCGCHQPKEVIMTRSTIRLIRFGSAKTLTLAGDGEQFPEAQDVSIRYDL